MVCLKFFVLTATTIACALAFPTPEEVGEPPCSLLGPVHQAQLAYAMAYMMASSTGGGQTVKDLPTTPTSLVASTVSSGRDHMPTT